MPKHWSELELTEVLRRPGYRVLEPVGAQPDRTPLPEDTPEGKLLTEIRSLAKRHGWLSYHTHDSRRSELGFPDLALCNGKSLLLYELKDNHRKLTHDQALWLAMLAHCDTIEAGLWRPHDWPSIVARLTRSTR